MGMKLWLDSKLDEVRIIVLALTRVQSFRFRWKMYVPATVYCIAIYWSNVLKRHWDLGGGIAIGVKYLFV